MTSPNSNSDDSMALTIVGVMAGPTLIGLLVGFWHEVVAWALKAGCWCQPRPIRWWCCRKPPPAWMRRASRSRPPWWACWPWCRCS